MHLKNILLGTAILLSGTMLSSFSLPNTKYPAFFKIGHRGTRGLMPENTIPAMIKAIELGCNTIEFDVHITKDGKVVVYHDASFNPEYTQMPDGSEIATDDRKKYTFYQMDYADIRKFKIGLKKYPAFPEQQQMNLYAPLLSEMIDSVELYTKTHKLPKVNYLLEIKSSAATDGFEQPAPKVVVDKLMADVKSKKLGDRLIIQSFDMRPLQVLHKKYPKVALGFLTGDYKTSIDKNLADLGFIPQFYNPHYGMVTPEMVSACHNKNMLICPWTVNEIADMKKVKALKVDGIITDYPNYFADIQN
ncbi:glycerophosphodiester phosphodiesterase family protein [Mucilaginibacter terrae]|uniref:Glycerophosphoryl diester phosphodiesterase n=1 Tax=Mucilaginibacter terrae TaxID=1955052 RepID=A0ABU3GQ46_9SPHI|nr:glycerophosphodiester phosphodiesterase family protein [Mucilaginibacter terrae]MDT3401903.1 glycerophosphoryl diester phosphodiesterase [Mucilaginibacter terrae]